MDLPALGHDHLGAFFRSLAHLNQIAIRCVLERCGPASEGGGIQNEAGEARPFHIVGVEEGDRVEFKGLFLWSEVGELIEVRQPEIVETFASVQERRDASVRDEGAMGEVEEHQVLAPLRNPF